MTPTSAVFRASSVAGYATGALDIAVAGRRVISIPSQLGCHVGCRFCVSKDTPLIRNLTTHEMLQMVQACFDAEPPDDRAVELSFTGEGEGLLNWKYTTACAEEAARRWSGVVTAVRYSCSGLGASKLLANVPHSHLPVRLQLSLHAARQSVRDSLIPRSESLDTILRALRQHEALFASIELNVVLQDGVNDSEEDLLALMTWGDPKWPILLNPLLADGHEIVATQTHRFAAALRAGGRDVKVFSRVGSLISRQRTYPLMSARPARAAAPAAKQVA
ncbi:radical SAM protein [Burkholderia multivorans]|uniref:radical SAM protein n=1 Tax=Burkholderia multivorans TaxID=87883 RepID=UPI001C230034|nr:radical SAM protein [Burkholderia multivorans]MBU9199865.1 radical SAM protein [Burkholderia multivorans]MDN8079016.1 radical SAM protein [Burkholderia multivorans]